MKYFFQHLRIGYRLGACFSAMLLLMATGTWLAASSSRLSREALARVVKLTAQHQADLSAMRLALVRQDQSGQRMMLSNSIEDATQQLSQMEASAADYRAVAERFFASANSPQELQIAGEMQHYAQQVQAPEADARSSVKGYNPKVAARLLAEQVVPVHARWLAAIDRLAALQNQRAAEQIQALEAEARRNDLIIGATGLGLLLLAALAAWRLSISITTPLRQAVQFAAAVGRGELGAPLPAPTSDEPGQLLEAMGQMAQRLQSADAAMQRLAIEDGLTGAFNRRHFDRVLQAEHERAVRAAETADGTDGSVRNGQLALLMIDVDHFKLYNDRFGHPAGDSCLQAVVGAARNAGLRPTDVLARYGGEEFVIVLPACDIEGACLVAERVRLAVHGLGLPSGLDPGSLVSVSIGVTGVADARTSTPAQLLRAADQALYTAKHAGRNQVRQCLPLSGDAARPAPAQSALAN